MFLLPCKGFWALLLNDRGEREIQPTRDSSSTHVARAWPSPGLSTANCPCRPYRPEPRGKVHVALSQLATGWLSVQSRQRTHRGCWVGHGPVDSSAPLLSLCAFGDPLTGHGPQRAADRPTDCFSVALPHSCAVKRECPGLP